MRATPIRFRLAALVAAAAAALGPATVAAAVAASRPPLGADLYARFFEAQELLSLGRGAEARQILEEVLAADPNAADVHAELARLCLKDGDVLCAETHAGSAVRIDAGQAAGHRVLADIDLQRSRGVDKAALQAGLAHLEAAAQADPRDVSTWVLWVRVLASDGRIDEAEAVARRAAAVPGGDPAPPNMALGRVLLARGETERAIAVLERVEATGRAGSLVLETLADLKAGKGDVAGQAAVLERLQQLRPDDPEVAHRLGAARLELGDFWGALQPLREAREARPSEALVARDLARTLVRLGRGGEALELLEALPAASLSPHMIVVWSQALEQAGRFAEAGRKLEQLVAGFNESDRRTFGPSYRVQAARNHLRSGDAARALDLVEGLDADASVLRLQLEALDRAGRGAEAARRLETVRAERGGDPGIVALSAERALRGGADLPTVVARASADLRRSPDRPAAAALVAQWLLSWSQAPLAGRLLDAIGVPAQPGAAVLRARAATLFASGRLGEAEAAFRRLLEAEPKDDAALNDLGYLLASEGRALDEAITLLQRAVALRPDEPSYLDSLGWALHRAGRSEEALPILKRAARATRDRDEPSIREHLGDVYAALGDRERARAEWSAALALGSEERARLQRKLADLAARDALP